MPNLCQNARFMTDSCQKVRKAKNMPYFDRKGQSWQNGRKWDLIAVPNLCQIYAKMPDLCQIHARRSGKPKTCHILTGKGRVGIMGANGQKARKAKNMQYFDRKGQSWHNGRDWEHARRPNQCQFNAKMPEIMPDSCQKVRKATNIPYFDQNGQSWHNWCGCDYFKMPNSCQIYAKMPDLCQIHARRSSKDQKCQIWTK